MLTAAIQQRFVSSFLLLNMLFWTPWSTAEQSLFPQELVAFTPYSGNPLFEGAGPGHWDENIRERGWILKEDGVFHMWYTGYASGGTREKHLGYATSPDGIHWARYPGNPIHSDDWVEDLMVVKRDGAYYMFAEGENDRAHLLVSTDRIHWRSRGTLDVRKADGTPLSEGPFGTPSVIFENDKWYLFYEREDDAIWLATSSDLEVWTNVQDDPVILRGPEPHERTMIALNQVLKVGGRYYAYYHGICPENGPDRWNLNVAVSSDLVHWRKYAGNPIIEPNHSSGFLVDDGSALRLYCMHPSVRLFFSTTAPKERPTP